MCSQSTQRQQAACQPEEVAEQAHQLMDQAEKEPTLARRLDHLGEAYLLLGSLSCRSLPVRIAQDRHRNLLG